MAIVDVEKASLDELKWYATNHYNADPTTFKNDKIYEYEVRDVDVVPTTEKFNIIPKQIATFFQDLENSTSAQQSQTIKFSAKVTETTSTQTTEGYKIGSSIKSTTKAKIGVSFIATGNIEQSVEIAVTGEYNHSANTTSTHSEERVWEVTQPVVVPPYKRVVVTLIIMGGPITIPMKLSANIRGLGVDELGGDYWLSRTEYKTKAGKNEWAVSGASSLYNTNWPGKSSIFVSEGSEYSVNVNGIATASTTVGLYTRVRFDETPLPGFPGESKTYYSPMRFANGEILSMPETFGEFDRNHGELPES